MHVVCVSEVDLERGDLFPDVDGDAGRDLVLVFELEDDLLVLQGGFAAGFVEIGEAYLGGDVEAGLLVDGVAGCEGMRLD